MGKAHNYVKDVKCPWQWVPWSPSNDCPCKSGCQKKKKRPDSQSRTSRMRLCRCYSSGSDLSQYLTLNLTVAVAQRPCSGDWTRGGRVFMLSFFFSCPSFSSCRPLFHQHRPVYSFSLAAVLSRILAVLLTSFCFDLFTTSSLPSPTTAQAAFCSRDDVLSFCRACLFILIVLRKLLPRLAKAISPGSLDFGSTLSLSPAQNCPLPAKRMLPPPFFSPSHSQLFVGLSGLIFPELLHIPLVPKSLVLSKSLTLFYVQKNKRHSSVLTTA